jgi:hypothetical protein
MKPHAKHPEEPSRQAASWRATVSIARGVHPRGRLKGGRDGDSRSLDDRLGLRGYLRRGSAFPMSTAIARWRASTVSDVWIRSP